MNQPSLFDSLEKPIVPPPVRPEPLIKYLNNKLSQMRRAQISPWTEHEHKYEIADFHRFTKVLPEDIAKTIMAEFEVQTARLFPKP